MVSKLKNALRSLLVILPMLFLAGSVIPLSHCSNNGSCDGDVAVTTEEECAAYAADNDCETYEFSNDTCNVTNCLNCEIIVDDGDFVIDVDDSGF